MSAHIRLIMIYFSELKNKRVYTEDGLHIGWLDDLIFKFTEIPVITQLVVKPARHIQKQNILIPTEHLIRINNTVLIAKNYLSSSLKENELYVNQNLIDKQIIDITGNKVVRVNDALIQDKIGQSFFIAGVDAGVLGILRWLNLEGIVSKGFALFGRKITSYVLPWSSIQPLELSQGKVLLNVQQEKLEKLHPEDLADYLETTNLKNIIKTVNLLQYDFAAEVIAELNLNYQIALFKHLGHPKTAKIISLMDPDEAVDAVSQFSQNRKQAIMKLLDKEKRKELENLLKLGESPVGQYMTSEFVAVESEDTVSTALSQLKKESSDITFLNNIYVLGKKNQLVGTIRLRDLLIQSSEVPAFKFMDQNLVVCHLNSPLPIVWRKMIKYKLTTIPVIDADKKIMGIITFDDIAEAFSQNI